MFRFKLYRQLRGSIALYVLVWVMLIFLMLLLAFSLECEKRKNLVYLGSELKKTSIGNMYREYLFSSFNQIIKDNVSDITQYEVDKYIEDNYYSFRLPPENCPSDIKNKCWLYFKVDKTMIFTYIDEANNKIFECYKIKAIDGKIKFFIIQDGVLTNGNNL
jgi:hypothetical protein